MKRIANYLIATALMAFTFTSCEDVPSPFGSIVAPVSGETVVITPSGSGTEADPYNVAAVLDYINTLGADTPSPSEVYIKGYVTETTDISAQYGNATFNMSDTENGANKFTVYRAKGLNNENVTDEKFIKEGDLVVVCGKVTNYKGNTPETVQGAAYVYSVNGNGGGASKPDTPTPTPSGDAKGTGTQADPFNIAAAIAKCQEIGESASTEKYYVKGIVVKGGTASDGYGNVTFTLGDSKDATELFTAYQVAGSDGEKLADGYTVSEGAEVVIYGPIYNYKGNTPETAGKSAAQIVTINGKKTNENGGETPSTGDAAGSGTEADPYNVAAIAEITSKLGDKEVSTDDYYIKGKICSIKYTFSADYGTATFNISDDGKTGGTEFTAYSVLYYNMASWANGDTQVAVGDDVVLYGKVTNYGGTLETSSKKACIYSLNGKTADDNGGGNQGGGNQGGGDGSNMTRSVDNLTLTLTNTSATASSNTLTIDFTQLGWTHQQENPSATLSDGTTIALTVGDGSTTPKYWKSGNYDEARCYAKNVITINASKPIAKIVVTCTDNNGTPCVGNETLTANTSGNTCTIINEHSSASGGTQLRMKTMVITYAN